MSSEEKLRIITRMTDEAQQLLDVEVKSSYNRGYETARQDFKISAARWESFSSVLFWGMLFGLLFKLGSTVPGVLEALSARYPPAPPEKIIPEDITQVWVPIAKGPLGTLHTYHPEPDVKCYKMMGAAPYPLGCVSVNTVKEVVLE